MLLTRFKGNIFNLITLLQVNVLERVKKSDYFKRWAGYNSVFKNNYV